MRSKHFSESLAQIRSLRNRIAHQKPVMVWNLPRLYASVVEKDRLAAEQIALYLPLKEPKGE